MSRNRAQIEQDVIKAAGEILYRQQYVSPVDMLVSIGLLQLVHVQDWHKGKIPYLEPMIQGGIGKISFAMNCFRIWANKEGLNPSETVYLAQTTGPKTALQFSESGDGQIEKAYRTHYISPALSEKSNLPSV